MVLPQSSHPRCSGQDTRTSEEPEDRRASQSLPGKGESEEADTHRTQGREPTGPGETRLRAQGRTLGAGPHHPPLTLQAGATEGTSSGATRALSSTQLSQLLPEETGPESPEPRTAAQEGGSSTHLRPVRRPSPGTTHISDPAGQAELWAEAGKMAGLAPHSAPHRHRDQQASRASQVRDRQEELGTCGESIQDKSQKPE